MDDFSFLVPLGFLAFFALMVYWVISSQRGRTQAKRQRAAQLGLSPVENPPPALLERLARLRQSSSGEKASLKNIFTRRLPDGNLFLFDLETSSGEDSSSLTEDMILVISTSLNLPRFGIFPKPAASLGIAGGLVDKLLQWMISRSHLVLVPVSQPRAFAERYALLAESQAQVSALIESGLLEQLATVNDQHIQAEGDAFTFSNLPFGRQLKQPQNQDLVTLIDQAQRVLHILEGYRGLR